VLDRIVHLVEPGLGRGRHHGRHHKR
jgi:hypothetical protein